MYEASSNFSMKIIGQMFNAKEQYREIKALLQVGTLTSLSPYIEAQAEQKFLGPPYEFNYHANQVALAFHDGVIRVISRVTLTHKGNESQPETPALNKFNDNYLYYQIFDHSFIPLTYSAFLGIPAPTQFWYNVGPRDPKLFTYQGRMYVIFNMNMAMNTTHNVDFPFLWDFERRGTTLITFDGNLPVWTAGQSMKELDKHWTPLVTNDKLYLVYTLDPLRIFDCELHAETCYCRSLTKNKNPFQFDDGVAQLRGGTPFIPYHGPYYVSFVLSKTFMKMGDTSKPLYQIHIVVLSISPTCRVVFVSHPLKLSLKFAQFAIHEDSRQNDEAVSLYPVSLVKEDMDTFVLSISVRDQSSLFVRITGMEKFIQKIITTDQDEKPSSGPLDNTIQEYVHNSISQNMS